MTGGLGNLASGARGATWGGRAAWAGHKAGLGYEVGSAINQVYTGGQKLADGNLWGLVDVGLGIIPAVGLKNALKFRTPKFAGSHVTPPARAAEGIAPGRGANVLGQVDNVILERLRLGAQLEVRAGTQGIRRMISDLSVASGNEVALVRLANGKRFLVMGGPNTVTLPRGTVRVIAHTHPSGSLQFSSADLRALSARGQRSSVIISPWDDFGIRIHVGGN